MSNFKKLVIKGLDDNLSDITPPINFKEWCKKYIEISDFAELIVAEESLPDATEWEVIERYLIKKQANEELYLKFYKMFLLYKASFDSYQQELIVKHYIKEHIKSL